MDENMQQDQNNEESRDVESGTNHENYDHRTDNYSQRTTRHESYNKLKQNRLHTRPRSRSQQRERTLSRSRSHSRLSNYASVDKRWSSTNAFINFVQDFRQNYSGLKSAKIFQLAGEQWRHMSRQEKQPYIEAANNAKDQKHDQKAHDQPNKSKTGSEQKKPEPARKSDLKKNGKKRKQNRRVENNTESDTDSATSGTVGTLTSEDVSDASS